MRLRNILLSGILALAVLFTFTMPAMAGYDHYQIWVYKDVGYTTKAGGYGDPLITGVQYKVLNGGTETASTLYSDNGITSKTNPVSATTFATDDKIDFYIDDTYTTVDIIVVDSNGCTLFMNGVTSSVHRAIINERPNEELHGFIWYTAGADGVFATAETDTEIDFPIGSTINRVAVETVVAASGSDILLEVGLDSDQNALMDYELIDGADLLIHPSVIHGTADSHTLGDHLNAAYDDLASDDFVYVSTSELTLVVPSSTMLTAAASLSYRVNSVDENTTTGVGAGYIHYWFSLGRAVD